MRKRIRLGLFVALLLAAAVLALVADATFSVGRDLESPQLTVAEPSGLRVRIADSLLGAGDDRELRELLRRFAQTRAPGTPAVAALEEHGELEAKLARLVASGDDPARRSLAANLNGILLYEHAGLDPSSEARFLELSLGSFREAAKLNPDNVDAKVNLELLAALLRERQGQLGGRSGSSGDSGAGSSSEGSGY